MASGVVGESTHVGSGEEGNDMFRLNNERLMSTSSVLPKSLDV